MKQIILKITIPLALIFISFACADLNENLTQPDEINIHVDGIANTSSPNFHANTFRDNNWNVESCQQCHASDYAGGTAGVSCNECHSTPGGPGACNTCHGSFDDVTRIAPPTDLNNNVTTSNKGVGAHASHVYDNTISAYASCYDCHPNQVEEGKSYIASHIDGLPAEISIVGYDAGATTCSNTYCHGNFQSSKNESSNKFGFATDIISGNNFSPIWTKVDDTQAACGTCHGLPPTGHVAADINTCNTCHPGIVDNQGNIVDPLKHIDGNVTLASAEFFNDSNCSNCHGNESIQPFVALGGETSKSYRGVALHDEHLFLNDLAVQIGCEDCHKVPATFDAEGHFDATINAELTFLQQDGTLGVPGYNYSTLQCSNTYCHGNFAFQSATSSNSWGYTENAITGNSTAVTWQSPSENVTCTSCHGIQPTGHIAVDPNSCATCHYGEANYSIEFLDHSTHIDGNIQLAGSDYFNDPACDNCHGNNEIQPFYGIAGATSKDDRGVALHDEHLFTNLLSKIECEDCHIVPSQFDSEGHFDNTASAEVTLWQQSGTSETPSYSSNSLHCSNTYCHGNFKYDKASSDYPWVYTQESITGSSESVRWQSPANKIICGSCHGLPPTGHVEAELTECADCHAGIVDATGNIIDTEKHINGVANVFGN